MTEKTEDHKKRVPVVQPLSATHSKQVGITRQLRQLFKTKSASIIAVLLVAGLPSYYFYHKSVVANQKLTNPTEANKKAIDEVEDHPKLENSIKAKILRDISIKL